MKTSSQIATASSPFSLLLVLVVVLLVATMNVPTVSAASFVTQVKGQKAKTTTTSNNRRPKHERTNVQALPILQLQAVAKTAEGEEGAKKKKKAATKKTMGTATATAVEALRKGDLIDRLAVVMNSDNDEKYTKKQAEAALSAVLQVIQEEVASGKKVMLPSFGAFVAKDRAARKGRNPQTGQEIDIPASRSPGFTPSKAWKDALNGK